jgi:signal peptidase I
MSRSDKKKELISNTALIGISAVLVMLISCQFRYGIIVVGSGSMTGSIDMGDAVVFEKYDKQEIELGQVIIFDYNGMKTIHRVVDIQKVDGEWRYYTKGDANALADNDYRLKKDVEALVKFKVKYIGYPTLFIRSIFLED